MTATNGTKKSKSTRKSIIAPVKNIGRLISCRGCYDATNLSAYDCPPSPCLSALSKQSSGPNMQVSPTTSISSCIHHQDPNELDNTASTVSAEDDEGIPEDSAQSGPLSSESSPLSEDEFSLSPAVPSPRDSYVNGDVATEETETIGSEHSDMKVQDENADVDRTKLTTCVRNIEIPSQEFNLPADQGLVSPYEELVSPHRFSIEVAIPSSPLHDGLYTIKEEKPSVDVLRRTFSDLEMLQRSFSSSSCASLLTENHDLEEEEFKQCSAPLLPPPEDYPNTHLQTLAGSEIHKKDWEKTFSEVPLGSNQDDYFEIDTDRPCPSNAQLVADARRVVENFHRKNQQRRKCQILEQVNQATAIESNGETISTSTSPFSP